MSSTHSGSPGNTAHRVLLVEDDAGIGRVTKRGLADHGIDVDWLRECRDVLRTAQAGSYHAIVLDLMLPDGDGFTLCRQLREAGVETPVCMLTARDGLDDKLEGFARGADDYLTKPFALEELAARLRALFRRKGAEADALLLSCGDTTLDRPAREVRVSGELLEFTRREFDVLAHLMARPGMAVSRAELLDAVWHRDSAIALNTVDVYVGYLRKKLLGAGSALRIESVRGVGFKLL